MSDVLLSLLGFVVRVGLLLAALVFFASLMVAGLVLLIFWLLRALWAKLTGQPVSPWTFQVNRQAVWQRFNQPGGGSSKSDNVVDAEVKDVTDVSVVTDTQPKRVDHTR